MDPFVEQLRELCAAWPTRAKWVFVPSHAVGHGLGEQLTLDGVNWANLRFVTPLDIAVRMAAPFLVEHGIDPSEEGLGPALVMRLLLALPENGGYFRPMAGQPPMAQALWSTLRELRLAGVQSTDLTAAAFESPEKFAEMRALLAAYEAFLARAHRADVAAVFDEATKHLDWCPIQAPDCWTEMPDTVWQPVQRRLLDTLPGERIAPRAMEMPGTAVPRRLRTARVERVAPGTAAPLAYVLSPARQAVESAPTSRRDQHSPSRGPARAQLSLFDAPTAVEAVAAPAAAPAIGARLQFFRAGGPEAEVEEVFRRVLASGARLDEVEIVCASDTYATLIWEKALRYEWPVTLSTGIPAAVTRPGRALLALVTWIEDDFSASHLRTLLDSGDVTFGDTLTLSPARASRLLVRAQAAWGRDTYRLSLQRLATSSRTRASREDLSADERSGLTARAADADALAGWINDLIAGVPRAGGDGLVDLQALVSTAEQFVSGSTSRASALDVAAAAALSAVVGDLRSLGAFRCRLDQALRFLRERVETLSLAGDRARPGHLHVSRLTARTSTLRRYTFVVGLEEGRVFPPAFENPVLLDAERQAISPHLASAADRIDEAVYAATARLARMSGAKDGTCTFSYSCRDLREFRETHASWLLLQIFRTATSQPAAGYQDLRAALGTPVSCVPHGDAAVLGESRWWLARAVAAGASARKSLLHHYPSLGAGLTASEARESASFTEYDGFVPDAGPALDPCTTSIVVSPTQLEEAAECPYRFFLRRGLGVQAIESGERDRDIWLDPLIRGSLLHDLYAEFLRRCRTEQRRAQRPADVEWLRQRGDVRLRELAREMPPPSEEVRERETRTFLDDLALFAAAEADADPDRTPIAFEVAFGRTEATDDEPLAQAEPVVVDLGGGLTFRLAGRIDRIDRIEHDGATMFEIVDYKTGGYWEQDWRGTFAGGRRLQHALYGLAAVELLKRQYRQPRIAGAHYYFSSAKGRQERKVIPDIPASTVSRVLSDLRDVIAAGAFLHAPKKDACKFCDYGHACGSQAVDAAQRKLDGSSAELSSIRRLLTHD